MEAKTLFDEAGLNLAETQKLFEDAESSLQLAEAYLEEVKSGIDESQKEIDAVVESFSDEQIFALNRSLNNAVNSDLEVEFTYETLQAIADENYSSLQINMLTKGLEEKARFTAKSEDFLEKYEKIGNEKFMEKSEWFVEKAESQEEKFLKKVTMFGRHKKSDLGETTDFENKIDDIDFERDTETALEEDFSKNSATLAALDKSKFLAKDAAKITARDISGSVARDAAKDAAKSAAKNAAKVAARLVAKDAAKSAAKDVAKIAAKGAAKLAAKDAAKLAAKDIVKESIKEAKNEAKREARKDRIKLSSRGKGKS